jgi:hypothetical protein
VPLALLRRRYGRVLERRLLEHDGHEQHGHAPGTQHAGHLAHRAAVVGHVLQDVYADDQVEGVVLERHVGDVHVLHRLVALEVGAHVERVRQLREAALERVLRRPMKDRDAAPEEAGALAQVEPQRAVPFLRAAARADACGAVTQARHEAAEAAAAARALDAVAAVEQETDPAQHESPHRARHE